MSSAAMMMYSRANMRGRLKKYLVMIMILLLTAITASESFVPTTMQRTSLIHPLPHVKPIQHANIVNRTFDLIWNNNPLRSLQLNMRQGRSSNRIVGKNFRLPNMFRRLTVTNALLALNVAMFLLLQIKPRMVRHLLKSNSLIGRGEVYRLFSSLFTHTAFYHILMNCYSLNSLGPIVNSVFGSQKYLIFYLFSGVFANLATFVMDTSPYSIGASGSIFGLLGALGMFYWRNQAVLGPSAKTALTGIRNTIAYNLIFSLTASNIDNNAHIAGFLGGALISFIIGPRLYRDRSL
jgi:membrane associated rhomboid family serine protease